MIMQNKVKGHMKDKPKILIVDDKLVAINNKSQQGDCYLFL